MSDAQPYRPATDWLAANLAWGRTLRRLRSASARFDVDAFVAECLDAAGDPLRISEVVAEVVREPAALASTLGRKLHTSDFGILHYSDELTVQHVVFPPGHRTGVHDHNVWAVIGVWSGYEDNHSYRCDGGAAVEQHVDRCEAGSVLTLDADAVHEVTCPPDRPSAALHVYGGRLFDQPRHSWAGSPLRQRALDDAAYAERYLEELRAADLLAG